MRDPVIVDIVMPVRDAEATVAVAVDSIRKQTVSSWRLIVIDDGSTDTTASILARLAEEDTRILILRGPQQGVVGSLNLGLEQCDAPFVARQDADDIAYPDRLERQLATFATDPDCIAIGCNLRHIDEDGSPTGSWGRFRSPETSDPERIPAFEPYIAGPVFIARRTALQEVGGFRFMRIAEDSDLCWRLQEQGRLYNTSDVLADYRMHQKSITSRSIWLGRLNAVCSQRSALSAQRRRSGRPDLDFSQSFMTRQDQLSSMAALIEHAAEHLDVRETDWLRAASAAKLVELVLYRPFELEEDDCCYIAEALRSGSYLLSNENRAALAQMLLTLTVRLAISNRFRNSVLLMRRSGVIPTYTSWLLVIAQRVRMVLSTRLAKLRDRVLYPNWWPKASAGRRRLSGENALV